jgi:fumarate hydratase, class I
MSSAASSLFPLADDTTPYRKLDVPGVTVETVGGRELVNVPAEAIRALSKQAFIDINHLLRPGHLAQLASILSDPEATSNDKFVAFDLLKNANIAAGGVLPMCQDTGTAIVMGKKGRFVWTDGTDEDALADGVRDAYFEKNLRYSQLALLSMFEERNTRDNLPAQIDIYAEGDDAYKFLFVAKGGGSANKMYRFQETKALLNPKSFEKFVADKLPLLGTSACPPYHLVFVVGGTSAEACMKTLKLTSAKYLDALPTTGNEHGRAFRDLAMEEKVLQIARASGIGAQFGGKYFAIDVRVVRLPRHGASCPVAMGVSCSADRNIKAKITKDGLFLEQLERNPGRFIPAHLRTWKDDKIVRIDLNQPMAEILAELSRHPVTTRVSLNGPLIVARDIAHAKLKERLDAGQGLPQYLKEHPVYYAGPAKTPKGYASGSFGPTTAGRMDSYVDLFQSNGGSMVMVAKGNRSVQVTNACKKHGGFYLGSIGGPAAILAKENIKKVEVLEYPELGMEAVWKIEVQDFPAFILVDNKGNDFFVNGCGACLPATGGKG